MLPSAPSKTRRFSKVPSIVFSCSTCPWALTFEKMCDVTLGSKHDTCRPTTVAPGSMRLLAIKRGTCPRLFWASTSSPRTSRVPELPRRRLLRAVTPRPLPIPTLCGICYMSLDTYDGTHDDVTHVLYSVCMILCLVCGIHV